MTTAMAELNGVMEQPRRQPEACRMGFAKLFYR